MIFDAHTLCYEQAVVVEFTAAAFAQFAMLGRLRLYDETKFAEIRFRHLTVAGHVCLVGGLG